MTKASTRRKSESSTSIGNEASQVGIIVKLRSIKLPKKQPRRFFDVAKMEQLEESIDKYGILEPLIVRPVTAKTYELVAGERRYRAAKKLGLTEIPVVVRKLNEQEAWELALLENLQRDDLNPIDETEGILELICQALNITTDEVTSLLNQAANAKRRDQPLTDNVIRQLEIVDDLFRTVGRLNRESFRTNRLPLLNLPEDVLGFLRNGGLEYTKAKAIAKLTDRKDRQTLMQQVVEERLSLSEVKRKVKKLLQGDRPSLKPQSTLRSEFESVIQLQSDAWTDKRKQKKIERLLQELKTVLARK